MARFYVSAQPEEQDREDDRQESCGGDDKGGNGKICGQVVDP